jgi:exodeoxyribonuclease V alpha subunit
VEISRLARPPRHATNQPHAPPSRYAVNDGRTVDPGLIGPSRLGDVQTVHAMSIHRSQGSQFDAVTVMLPPLESPLLTRELLYTAVTRAKEHVRLIGTHAALVRAVETPIVRASGLRHQA